MEPYSISALAAFLAFLGGLVPALLWLTFWLREDKKRPEPRGLILIAFLTGMIAVAPTLPLQSFAAQFVPLSLGLLLIWAAIEEALKFTLAYATVLRRHSLDEPIDYPMYLITVALGFAALENMLFLIGPISGGNVSETIITGNLRFIGATLIHVLSSAVLGGALAFSFYREGGLKLWYGFAGIILAVTLHALFNFLILSTGADRLLTVFLGVWVGIIALLLALERVKRIYRPQWWERMFTKHNPSEHGA